jgi:hypothetical protein
MTRVIREGKKRRTPLLLFAILAVMAGVLIGGGSYSSAAPSTDASVTDYSQCAQGAPGTAVPPTGTNAGTCVQNWINGILQSSNSQYSEDQVTAQRLVIDLPNNGPTTGRTITLKYLWNKGSNHAYDSLARWNTTINWLSVDGVCAGIPGGANGCPVRAAAGTAADYGTTNGLGTSAGNANAQVPSSPCSAGHELSDRTLAMFGGTITQISTPVNDSPSPTCSLTADEYETVTITYSVPSTPTRVMLLFGGHLAAGGGPRSWGAGKGSSSINGGPYHIKLTTLDTSSIGNRDNQISSGAILPLSTGVTTLLHQTNGTNTGTDVSPANNGDPTTGALTVKMPAAGGGVYVTDFATVTPTGATGTVDFRYYSGATASADCSAATLASEGGNDAGTGKTLNASGVAQSTEIHFSSIDTIYWRAFFHGTDISNSSSSACSSEILTVQQNTTTATTLHQVTDIGGATDVNPSNNGDPITVPINAFVKDVAQVTPGTSATTGSVAFRLYSGATAQTDCGNDTAGTGGADEGSGAVSATGAASSSVYHATSAGTFYWKAFFTGTGGNNNSASSCEKLIVAKASPTVASAPWLVPQDAVTIAGIASGGTTQATVTFDLFPPSNSTCSTGGTAAVYHEVVNVNGDNTYSTSNSGNSPGGFRLTSSTTTSPLGVYHWHVVYSGDEANNANDRGCVEAFNFQGVTDQAAG